MKSYLHYHECEVLCEAIHFKLPQIVENKWFYLAEIAELGDVDKGRMLIQAVEPYLNNFTTSHLDPTDFQRLSQVLSDEQFSLFCRTNED